MRKDPTWMSGSIQNEAQATKILGDLGKAWYGFAIAEAAVRLIDYFSGTASLQDISQPGWYATAGFLLSRRHSRFLAVLLLVNSLFATAFDAVKLVSGLSKLTLLTFSPLIRIWLSYRAVHATYVYHRSAGSVILWRNVTIVVSLCVAIVAAICTSVALLLPLRISSEAGGDLLAVLTFGLLIACHFALGQRFPWVRPAGTAPETAPA